MAEDTDHEATRLRRLAMAADYEARANAAAAAAPAAPSAPVSEADAPDAAVAAPEPTDSEQPAPAERKTTRLRLDKQNVRGLKETIVVERPSTLRRTKPGTGAL